MTHHRFITYVARVGIVPLAALAFVTATGVGQAGAATAKKDATVSVRKTGLGKVLVDSSGRTLYLFKLDTGTQSQCTGACAANWPPLPATGKPVAGTGAKASLIGSTTRADGTSQVTYNGHPVYMFLGDQKAGQTNGEGVNAFGASWFAVSPAGNQVVKHGSNASTTPTTTGGSGY